MFNTVFYADIVGGSEKKAIFADVQYCIYADKWVARSEKVQKCADVI